MKDNPFYRAFANALRIPVSQVKKDMDDVNYKFKGDTMSCFTFEFGEPDSYIYHIPEGSVSHVTILTRGTTGTIHFKSGKAVPLVPRGICEALVAWICGNNPALEG